MAANKSFVEKKTNLETKRKQLADKLAKLQAEERERQRKLEAAQRLLVGRVALAHARSDAEFARLLFGIIDTAVTRPDERNLIADLVSRDTTTNGATNDNHTDTATGEASRQQEEVSETSPSET